MGKSVNEPTREAVLPDRVKKLERLVDQLTMENEFLKKALINSFQKAERKESSSCAITTALKPPNRGANS